MKSWLIALRLARREARRSKGRTLLIVAMIAIPVAALSFAAMTYDMYKLTPQEAVTRQLGAADAKVDWPAHQTPDDQPHTTATMLTHFPAGTKASPYWDSSVNVHTHAGIGSVEAFGIDTDDPMTTGMVTVSSGRLPRADNEVLASPATLDRLGAQLGSTINTLDSGSTGPDAMFPAHAYRIVGIGEVGGSLRQYLLFRPSQLTGTDTWLLKTPAPVTFPQYQAFANAGMYVTSRELLLQPHGPADSSPTVQGFSLFGISTIIGGLGLLEVVLLAGPAFTVGARRRQRELALVETSGGTPSTLRRIVLADGIVGGVAAAVVGVIVGCGAAVAGRPFLESHLAHAEFGAYRIYPTALASVVGLALLTGVLGALVPAITAGRQNVVAALTGRRGAVRSRLIWLFVGIAGVATGAVITYFGAGRHGSNIVLAGLVIGEFGIVLCTPTLIGVVAKLGRFLPVAPRIALRDAARRRGASAPAISAVMAAVAGSVALTVYLGASTSHTDGYKPTIPIGSVMVDTQLRPGVDAAAPDIASVQATLKATVPGLSSIAVTSVDGSKHTVIPQLPVTLACPYAYALDGRDLSTKLQRAAAADPRCTQSNMNVSFSLMSPIVTTDPAVLTAALGLHGGQLDAAVAALNRGQAVINDSRYVTNGTVALDTYAIDATGDAGPAVPATVPGMSVDSGGLSTSLVISPATAKQLELDTSTSGVVATPITALTSDQIDALQAAMQNAGLPGTYVEEGPTHDSRTIAVILAAAAAVIALGAAAIATGLAAIDGRSDLRTLGAVGATPRVRRVLALCQSGVIAGLGSLLGAIAGLGAGAAVLYALNRVWSGKWPAPMPYTIAVPWLNLIISVLIVPAVAMLGAGLITRSRLPIERRAD